MHISKVEIVNFRCFRNLSVETRPYALIVGANKAGKSNFIEAVKLAISPYLMRDDKILDTTDFWTNGKSDFRIQEELSVSVELTVSDKEVALFNAAMYRPNIARFTFTFRRRNLPLPLVAQIDQGDGSGNEVAAENGDTVGFSESQYESLWRMGKQHHKVTNEYVRERLSFEVLAALRDAEAILARWSRSPLRPLLRFATAKEDLASVTTNIRTVAKNFRKNSKGVQTIVTNLNNRGERMVGAAFSMRSDLEIDIMSNGEEDLLRYIQLYVDGNRPINRTSLGTQNILYLSLLLEAMKNENNPSQELILALEEPEAHVHPHVQRSIFQYFSGSDSPVQSLIITTHSPHISSVSPLQSIIILRDGGPEIGSKADYVRESFSDLELQDLQRYLDVTRAELIFSRGVIFVEGIAEQYLVPAFAKTLNMSLDHLGISVIPIHSTNFKPYVRLVSQKNLNIPFAVLTDGDSQVSRRGLTGLHRGRLLAQVLVEPSVDVSMFTELDLQSYGIFVGKYTLETDLVETCADRMIETFASLDSAAISKEFEANIRKIQQSKTFSKKLAEYPPKRIENRIGKGRFAQRLAEIIEVANDPNLCPQYIRNSLHYIVTKVPKLHEPLPSENTVGSTNLESPF